MKTLLVAFALLFASSAAALTPPVPDAVKDVIFDRTDNVDVNRLEPQVIVLRWLEKKHERSLIRYRITWKDEIVRSAGDI